MSCVATPAHASETFEWRIRQRSHARPAVQRGGSGGELLFLIRLKLFENFCPIHFIGLEPLNRTPPYISRPPARNVKSNFFHPGLSISGLLADVLKVSLPSGALAETPVGGSGCGVVLNSGLPMYLGGVFLKKAAPS